MIRILLVDDHKIVREGLGSLISEISGMEIIAEATSGREAIEIVKEKAPDVVVMDIAMPDMNGIEATRKILSNNPDVKVVALSMHSDRTLVTEALKAGASGYLLKDCAFEELSLAIEAVHDGKTYLSPSIANVVVKNLVHQDHSSESSAFEVLTDREREVLQLLAEGESTKEVAYKLDVSVKTIESHRYNIMHKLEIRNFADLVKYAVRQGLTTL